VIDNHFHPARHQYSFGPHYLIASFYTTAESDSRSDDIYQNERFNTHFL